ncbi:MAG: Crp/Fnr family transcriptional regulator [Pseudorhodoplanes sp.]|uniref:Crp/Fnr family transcriptional regulator n=1 Tax=Pseudorhodoplanes sp. TaxID=1934341 RepID=UPI003D0AC3DF
MTAIDFNLLVQCGSTPKTFRSGEAIFQEGEPADCLYVLRDGTVDITLGNRLLTALGAGEIFGEMALIDGAPRSANAIARTDVTVIPVNEKQFVFLVGHLPYFSLSVMRVLAERLRTMNRAL